MKKNLQQVKVGNNDGLHSIFYHLDRLVAWQKGENPPPLFVDISPTSQCNHDCFFCFTEFVRKNPKTIPDDLLIKIFKDLAAYGVNTCEVQGTGEPFLHKALPDAIVAGHEGGMNICVVTNGSAFGKGVLDKIMPHLAFMRFSNLESSASIYAQTQSCPEKHFGIVVKNLEQAVKIRNENKLDAVITGSVIVLDHNISSLVATIRMLKDIGVDIAHIKSAGILPKNQEHKWNTQLYRENEHIFQEAKALEDENFKVNYRADYFEFNDTERGPSRNYSKCYGTEFAVHIASDCKVYPCYMHWENAAFSLGDLTQQSFPEIWQSEHRKQVMNKLYTETDLDKCTFHCKQHTINRVLWQVQNPPTPNVF